MRSSLLLKSVVISFATILSTMTSHSALASEPGTIGVEIHQLYNEQQPTKRGVFMVRRVQPSSAAADAGIQPGDVVVAVDGKPVVGSDSGKVRKSLDGEVGSSIELSVVEPNDVQKKIVMIRKPYPPHLNASTDAFSYVIPGNWQMDPRYPFPLPWSPTISYKGFEDLAFAPGFDDSDSPEYHSYLILWWLDGTTKITAADLQADMIVYFQGLAKQRGRNNHFDPDLSRITAQYAASPTGPGYLGGAPATNFSGSLTLYDRHGNVISLYSEVIAAQCSPEHTAVYFSMSKEPRPASLWKQLDAVRDGFQCRR